MNRTYQIVFAGSILAACWLAMMAVHELGHILGATATGGSAVKVVLHPLTISRTDVSPNPHPAVVVWLGPIVGGFFPLLAYALTPSTLHLASRLAGFFAGFCLIANGVYIGLGSFGHVGDCREMLRTGSPMWALWAFGALSVLLGGYLWHRLGSMTTYFNNSHQVAPWVALVAFCVAAFLWAAGTALFPQ